MEPTRSTILRGFRIGALEVFPMRGLVMKPDGASEHLEPKVMDVLVCLAGRANILVTREDLLEEVWPERVAADNQLTRAISELRRRLGDKQSPAPIETVPKRGYRLVGIVELDLDDRAVDSLRPAAGGSVGSLIRVGGFFFAAAVAIALLLFGYGALLNDEGKSQGNMDDIATLSDAEVSTSDVLALQHYLEGVQQKQPETNKSLRLAELAFREALARDPGFIEAKLELGYTYWNLQRIGEISRAEAEDLIQPILDQLRYEAPDNGLVLALDTAMRYRAIVDIDAREDALIAAIARAPYEARLYRNLARLLAANGREEDALEWLDRGLRNAPNDWDLHAGRGRLLLRNGRNELAGASIGTALLLNPDNPTLLGNAASIAVQRGDYIDWYLAWLRAMEVAPHDDEIPGYLALQFYTIGLIDEADDLLQRAHDVQPRESWSQVPLLYRHLTKGDSEAAYELSQSMLIGRQENRWGANDIALTIFVSTAVELGETEDALQLLEKLSPGVSQPDLNPQSLADIRYRQSAMLLDPSLLEGARLATEIRNANRADLDIAFAIALGENEFAVSETLDALSEGLALVRNIFPYKRFRHLEILRPVVSDPRVSSRIDELDQKAARIADEIRTFLSEQSRVQDAHYRINR